MNDLQKEIAKVAIPFVRGITKLFREHGDETGQLEEASHLARAMAQTFSAIAGNSLNVLADSMAYVAKAAKSGADPGLALCDYFDKAADEWERELLADSLSEDPYGEREG